MYICIYIYTYPYIIGILTHLLRIVMESNYVEEVIGHSNHLRI